MNANLERLGELRLRQSDETTKGGDVAGFELAAHDALPLASTERATEVTTGKFSGPLHLLFSMYST
jgi:hypothetical protein